MENGDLIGTTEAMAILGVDRSTVIRWADRGKLGPVLKMAGLTGAFLIRRAEVERLRDQLAEAAAS